MISRHRPLSSGKIGNSLMPEIASSLGTVATKERLTGSDPLLSQDDKKLGVRGLTVCITWAFSISPLATTSY